MSIGITKKCYYVWVISNIKNFVDELCILASPLRVSVSPYHRMHLQCHFQEMCNSLIVILKVILSCKWWWSSIKDCFTFSTNMMRALVLVPVRIHKLLEISINITMAIITTSVSGAWMITFLVELHIWSACSSIMVSFFSWLHSFF